MVGNNTVIFNNSTMIQVLQYYFEKIYKDVPQVVAVKYNHLTYNFEISIENKKPVTT